MPCNALVMAAPIALLPAARDTLFLAAPVSFRGHLVQYAGRILRPFPGKGTAEIHDYHDIAISVLAASLAKRSPRYTSLGFLTPAASSTPRVRLRPGKSLTRPSDTQCVITRDLGLVRLETQPLLNHARQHRWRAQPTAPCAYSILTSTNKDGNRDVPHKERLLQTAPATHETRPTGPGLTCEFDGGRCWVRTNVG